MLSQCQITVNKIFVVDIRWTTKDVLHVIASIWITWCLLKCNSLSSVSLLIYSHYDLVNYPNIEVLLFINYSSISQKINILYSHRIKTGCKQSIVIHLQTHSILDLVVFDSYVILKDDVRLLKSNFIRTSSNLSRD